MDSETAALLGQRIGRIRIVDLLGEGGMGAVYLGFDEKLQRRVAVKAIRSEYRLHAEARARFLREARILSQLKHPRICTVHDVIEGDNADLLVLELVEGRSLRLALKDGLTRPQAIAIARHLLEVLVAVHGEGVIHRDLKPENVMITPDGGIKVLDFGLARSAEEDAAASSTAPTLGLGAPPRQSDAGPSPASPESTHSACVRTRLGSILGTAGYMSPEQARGEPATAASDMYSLGLILQEILTGEPPFERGLAATELLARAAAGTTRPVVGLPPDLTVLVSRLKSVAAGARPSALDASEMLQRVVDRPRKRRARAILAAAWTVVIAFAVGMAFQWWHANRAAQVALVAKTKAERIWQEAALIFYRRGDFADAVALYERAIADNVDLPLERAANRIRLAWILYALGRDNEAISSMRLALRDYPQLTLVRDYYTEGFCQLFDQLESDPSWTPKPALEGEAAPWDYLLGQASELVDRGDCEAALSLVRDAVARTPDDADLLEVLSSTAQRCGDLEEAERAVRAALALRPEAVDLTIQLSDVLAERGNPPAARDVLQALTERHPDSDRAWAALGLLDVARGDDARARGELERALAANPILHEPQVAYGELLLRAGDLEGSLRVLRATSNLPIGGDPLLAARIHAAMADVYRGLAGRSGETAATADPASGAATP